MTNEECGILIQRYKLQIDNLRMKHYEMHSYKLQIDNLRIKHYEFHSNKLHINNLRINNLEITQLQVTN